MRLEELYPAWPEVHARLMEALVYLPEAQLDYAPGAGMSSIKELVLEMLRMERWWAGAIIAGYEEYRPLDDENRTSAALVESLRATREITRRIMEPFSWEGLRAVRTVPSDLSRSQYETNMPISRLIWHVMENELMTWGQVQLRLADFRASGLAARNVQRN